MRCRGQLLSVQDTLGEPVFSVVELTLCVRDSSELQPRRITSLSWVGESAGYPSCPALAPPDNRGVAAVDKNTEHPPEKHAVVPQRE